MATAVMPVCSHRANMSLSRAAPSSMEYSVWTCRCTNEPSPPDPAAVTSNLLRAGASTGRGSTGAGGSGWRRPAGARSAREPRPIAGAPARLNEPTQREALRATRRAGRAPGGSTPGSALGAEDVQGVGEVGWIVAGEHEGAAVHGVGESQADRVQPLPGQAQVRREHGVGPVQ